jgi:hypothetical protein
MSWTARVCTFRRTPRGLRASTIMQKLDMAPQITEAVVIPKCAHTPAIADENIAGILRSQYATRSFAASLLFASCQRVRLRRCPTSSSGIPFRSEGRGEPVDTSELIGGGARAIGGGAGSGLADGGGAGSGLADGVAASGSSMETDRSLNRKSCRSLAVRRSNSPRHKVRWTPRTKEYTSWWRTRAAIRLSRSKTLSRCLVSDSRDGSITSSDAIRSCHWEGSSGRGPKSPTS